jgi:hypothetical protein
MNDIFLLLDLLIKSISNQCFVISSIIFDLSILLKRELVNQFKSNMECLLGNFISLVAQ